MHVVCSILADTPYSRKTQAQPVSCLEIGAVLLFCGVNDYKPRILDFSHDLEDDVLAVRVFVYPISSLTRTSLTTSLLGRQITQVRRSSFMALLSPHFLSGTCRATYITDLRPRYLLIDSKSLSLCSKAKLLSIQKVAIITSIVFLRVIPFWRRRL